MPNLAMFTKVKNNLCIGPCDSYRLQFLSGPSLTHAAPFHKFYWKTCWQTNKETNAQTVLGGGNNHKPEPQVLSKVETVSFIALISVRATTHLKHLLSVLS